MTAAEAARTKHTENRRGFAKRPQKVFGGVPLFGRRPFWPALFRRGTNVCCTSFSPPSSSLTPTGAGRSDSRARLGSGAMTVMTAMPPPFTPPYLHGNAYTVICNVRFSEARSGGVRGCNIIKAVFTSQTQ
jgi:hypothetical protein